MTPKISRREFLKIGTAGAISAVLAGCQQPRRWVVLEPFVRPPEEQVAGEPTWYASTCRQCPAGCGIIVRIMNGRALKIEGNPGHPLNKGKLCARGQAGLQVLYNPDRLEGPVQQSKRNSRQYQSLSWDAAIQALSSGLNKAGSQVAIWNGSTTSGHVYDLFSRFAAAIGASAPIVYDLYTGFDGYSTLNSASQAIFNQAGLPAFDLGRADVVLSFGADFLATGLSATRYGIEFGRMRNQPSGTRGYLVQLEPHMSTTGAKADRWLPIRPGSEALVAQAIASIIASQSLGSKEQSDRARALAPDVDLNQIATASDLSADDLTSLAHLFIKARYPVAIPGNALVGGDHPAEAIAAVLSLNLIAGNVGTPGGLLPQAALPIPSMQKPAINTFGDIQKLIANMNAGQVQALLVYNANPAYDIQEGAGFVKALEKVPFVVSFAPILDETAAWADLVLPDRTYLESWGYEVVSPDFGYPAVSSQQPVVAPVYDNHSTADVILAAAKAIPAAASALKWPDEVAFLKESISGLIVGSALGSEIETAWAHFQQNGGWWPGSAPAAAAPGGPAPAKSAPVPPVQFQSDEKEYPYYLHLFLSSLLSDGRGANQPWLQGSPDTNTTISWQTWAAIHPTTAQKLNLKQGDVVEVASAYGAVQAIVYLFPGVRPDTVAIPLGQGHTDYGRYAQNRGANAIQLVGSQSGTTAGNLTWASIRVKITPTGRRKNVAAFGNTMGVEQGFLNKSFPGQ